MKQRYVQRNGKLVPRDAATARHHMVQDDLDPFVSHVDGSVIGSNADLREHNKKHNVVSFDESLPDMEAARKQREQFYTPGAGHDRKRRIDALRFAIDLESSSRTESDRKQIIENYIERN